MKTKSYTLKLLRRPRPGSRQPPTLACLQREALVTRLRETEHQSFSEIAKHLGTTREIIRQTYARARRRRGDCDETRWRSLISFMSFVAAQAGTHAE